MAYRMGGGGNNRRADNRFDRGGFGGGMNRPNPWGGDNMGGNFRQGGGNGGGMNNDVLSLANSLVNNLLRNQNHPPSLLDLPNRGGYGGGRDGRFNDRMGGFNRNMPNRRNGPPGARQKNDKLGAIKGGIRKRNAVSSAKKVLAKNAKDDASDAINPNLSAKNAKKESKYADVPNVMFYCHMCKKHMWDAVSFENHVKGRTHMMMRDGVEESYRLRANMIRQEAKIEEQLKTIELERRSRMGKGGKGNRREYCTMCDLHFFGHLSTHRKSDGHLQLKKFLHPRCGDCAQEFPNRIDFDNHMLTPDHMKKAHANKSNKPERRKNALIIHTEEDELKDLREEKPPTVKKEGEGEEAMETDEATEKNGEGENGDVKEGEEKEEKDEKDELTEDGKAAADEKPAEQAPEPEDVILDVNEEEEVPIEIEARIPKYNCNRQIGSSQLHHLDCFECHICNRFFDTERTAEIHSRTVTHHRNFVKFLNEKSNDTKIAQRRAQAALEEIERKKKKLEEIANGEAAEKKEDGDETYDPSEETGENDKSNAGDETMESQDGDEQFEDANQTVKEDVAEPIVVEPIEPEPEPQPEPIPEVKASPKATPQRAARGRPGRGRRN